MKKVSGINLAFPCPENIDLTDGRSYCSQCKNNIYDFRDYTSAELEEILNNSSSPVCGKFNKSQLNKKIIKYAASTVLAIASISGTAHGQKIKLQPIDSVEIYLNDSIESEDEIFLGIILEEQATPIGGYENFYKAIMSEIKMPENLTNKAKVFLQIDIDSLGIVSEYEIIKSSDSLVNNEVIRALKKLNYKFEPAKQRGRPIQSKLIFPITFDPTRKKD